MALDSDGFPQTGHRPYGAAVKAFVEGEALSAKSDAQSAASADATAKANAAKADAIATASADATTKANNAKVEAKADAAADATTKDNAHLAATDPHTQYRRRTQPLSLPVDLDTLQTAGHYQHGYHMSNANAPLGDGGSLQVEVIGGTVVQRWNQQGTPEHEYVRRRSGSTWTTWVRTGTPAVTAHKTEASAHAADRITYAGGPIGLPSGTVESALDAIDTRTGVALSIADGVDLNSLTTTGLYHRGTSVGSTVALNYPAETWAGYIEVIHLGTSVMQRATSIYSNPGATGSTNAFRNVWYRTKYGSTWQPWVQFRLDHTQTLTTEDLNTLTTSGVFYQPSSAYGTLARNYPMSGWAGYIEVIRGSDGFAMQRATAINTSTGASSGIRKNVYYRTLFSGTWGEWVREDMTGHLEAADPHPQYIQRTAETLTTDLNAALTPGLYLVGSTAANAPFTNGGHLLISGQGGYRLQVMWGREGSNVAHFWYRNCTAATTTPVWTSWRRMAFADTANTFTATQGFETTGSALTIANPAGTADMRRVALWVEPSTGMLQVAGQTDSGDTAPAAQRFFFRREGGFRTGGVDHLYGTGDPNGVHAAPVGSVFRNTEAGGWNGARVWRKDSGTGNTGWVVESGDTGVRQVESLLEVPWTRQSTAWGVYLQRVGSRVTLSGYLNGASGDSIVVINLPAGFRPPLRRFGSYHGIHSGANPAVTVGAVVNPDGAVSIDYVNQVADPQKRGFLDLTFETTNSWPATLPGTAV